LRKSVSCVARSYNYLDDPPCIIAFGSGAIFYYRTTLKRHTHTQLTTELTTVQQANQHNLLIH